MQQFATFMILVWPLVTFFILNKYKMEKGSLLAFLLGYLFLPAGMNINVPMFPDLDKGSVTGLSILFYCFIKGKKIGYAQLPKKSKWMLIVLIFSPLATSITNNDYYSGISGLTFYDAFSSIILSMLNIMPFLIGAAYFTSEDAHQRVFKYIAFASLAYAVLALIEIRLSPQLHNWVYGYFPHSFAQQMREGGFRAVVFLGHGLLVALFLSIGLAMWVTLKNIGYKSVFIKPNLAIICLIIVLFLSKTYSAIVYALVALLLLRFASPQRISVFALSLSLLFMSYPILKTFKLFPQESIVNIASTLSVQRAGSLQFRFENEDMMLDHINEKPIFGWGGWGRNRVYDHITGKDITVTDGSWIIVYGVSGAVGFAATFFFLVMPIWLTYRLFKRRKSKPLNLKTQIFISSHSLILAIITIDQLPNSSLMDNPLYWLFSGVLFGRVHFELKRLK